LRKSSSFKASKTSKRHTLLGGREATSIEDLLPNLASIAAATEPGILALEEAARRLENAPLQEALQLVQGWSEELRRRPKADDSLASFKAKFLRSNALEKALEGLRKNEKLKNELSDRPLFASIDFASPAEALMAELRVVLQLCLPRSAAQLAEPVLQVVLAEPAEAETVTAAITVLRAFKDDWREVVRSQALRGLERKLDSLAYQLQKVPGSPALSSARKASHDRVAVLASLCEAIGESHVGAETRSAEIENALRSLGLQSPGGSSSSCPTVTSVTATAEPVSSVRSRASSVISGSSKGTTETEWPSGLIGSFAPGYDEPSHADCEAAVSAMATKTESGMREGLRLLGLPCSPLHFIANTELRLCGHDIRVAVCKMMTHWMEDDKPAFFEVLQRIRQILQKPQKADLIAMRNGLIAERQALAEKVQRLDRRISEVDAQLASAFPGWTPSNHAAGGDVLPDVLGVEEAVPMEGNLNVLGSFPPRSATSTSVTSVSQTSRALTTEMSGIVMNVAEALTLENQRTLERLATMLQQRRTQLLAGLREHLQGEEARLSALSVAPGGVQGAVQVASGQLNEAIQEATNLCQQVEAVVGSGRAKCNLSDLSVGTHCRARWMDGNFYDATIHSVQLDGTVVVNWLRPRPASGSNLDRPLRTIIQSGGDDSLHRIVPKADIQIEGVTPWGQSEPQAALNLFNGRQPEDRQCVDCGAADAAQWASLSFGTYLCRICAEEHKRLGPRTSLVRQLNDGWGWTTKDLKILSVGGNARFLSCLEAYPNVRDMEIAQRYVTRFAEHYRRCLDGHCTGAHVPPPIAEELASQIPGTMDFLSCAEALAVAQEASRRFEDAAKAARSQCKLERSSSCADGERGRRIEAPRSISDATGTSFKRRLTKVSC